MVQRSEPYVTLAIGLALAAIAGASCKSDDPARNEDYCGYNLGDRSCAELDAARPYCVTVSPSCFEASDLAQSDRYGCAAQVPAPDCRTVCGEDNPEECDVAGSSTGDGTGSGATGTLDDTTAGMDATTDAETDAGSTGDTTGPGPECTDATDCGGATPFCDADGTCVACDGMPDPDGACTEADAGLPVCEAGECVQCTEASAAACEGQTPICATDNTCVACVEHFECPDSACHLDGPDVGACFDEADVVMAANATALESAFAGVSSGDDLVIVLTGASYSDVAVDFLANAEVAVIGDGSNDLAGNTLGGIIDTGGTSIVYLSGVTLLSNGSGDGLTCSGTSVWLDDSEVRNNAQLGLDISAGCAAHLRRTVVRANSGGGIAVGGATTSLSMQNSAVVDNVGAAAGPGLQVTSSDLEIVYSTVVSNGTFAAPDNIECLSGASGSVRNSIFSGPSANSIVTCGVVSWDNNAVDTVGLGASNTNVGAYDAGWFANPGSGNYHLSASGDTTFADIAQWEDGDPLTDIDGDDIPTAMPSHPGYDQP